MWRYKTCGQGRGSAGPPGCCRPDGGNPALGRWDVVAACACALVGIRVSDTEFMTLTLTQKRKQPHAKRHRHDVRQRVSPRRPPARPPGGGHRKTLLDHPAVCKNLKNPTRPSARKDQAIRARGGVGLGWAGRLDAPGGNRREPKADEVEHGAVRSEGSGPQSEPRPPQAHAAPGVSRTQSFTSNSTPTYPTNPTDIPPQT